METLALLVLSFGHALSGWLSLPSGWSLPPLLLPVQDVLSAAVAANRRHQSHCLRRHSLPISPLLWRQLLQLVSQICSSMCSASEDIYSHTITIAHMQTHTQAWPQTQDSSFSLSDPKACLLNLSLCCFLYPSLYVVGCWISTDRIHLISTMLAGIIVFIWSSIKGSLCHISSCALILDDILSLDHLECLGVRQYKFNWFLLYFFKIKTFLIFSIVDTYDTNTNTTDHMKSNIVLCDCTFTVCTRTKAYNLRLKCKAKIHPTTHNEATRLADTVTSKLITGL